MRKMAVAGAVVLGAAGTVMAGAVPASAAPKCWVGAWEVASTSAAIKTPDMDIKLKGGEGIKLKFTAGGKASYDFVGSKPLTGGGKAKGLPATTTVTLTKKLQMGNKISGSAKGKITGKPKTAKGDARITAVAKVGLITKTYKLVVAKEVKRSGDFGVVPRKATFTCAGDTLTIKQNINEKKLKSTTVWKLRRV